MTLSIGQLIISAVPHEHEARSGWVVERGPKGGLCRRNSGHGTPTPLSENQGSHGLSKSSLLSPLGRDDHGLQYTTGEYPSPKTKRSRLIRQLKHILRSISIYLSVYLYIYSILHAHPTDEETRPHGLGHRARLLCVRNL